MPRLFLLAFGLLAAACAADPRVLVYTRNHVTDGKGYVHENIATSVEAIRKMGAEAGFAVDHSDDPAVFTPDNLKRYGAIVFSNSNNEAFQNDTQREAFAAFLKAGGGYVGIHSATGSERKWPHYWTLAGGKFKRHPKFQKFTIRVADPKHPATRHLAATFEWTDECYYHEEMNPALRPLLVTDPAALIDPQKNDYPGTRFGNALPLAWTLQDAHGRRFYTALGHAKEHYADPILYRHILGGIRWALGQEK